MKRVFKIILICSIACLVSCSSQTTNITEEKETDKVIEEIEEGTIKFKSTSGNKELSHEEYLTFLELMNKKEECEDIFVINHEATYKFEFESEEYAVYPFQDIVILLNYQKGQYYWFTEDEDIDVWGNICNHRAVPNDALVLDSYNIIENQLGTIRVDENILKKTDYAYPFSGEQIANRQREMEVTDTTAISSYGYYDLIINDEKLYIREFYSQETFEVEGIVPQKLGHLSTCGGPLYSVVLTTDGELYKVEAMSEAKFDKEIFIDFDVKLIKDDIEEKITDLLITDTTDIYTTCGAPTICVTTENDSEWQIVNENDKFILGEKLSVVHPYTVFFSLGDLTTLFQEGEDVNMLYVYEDSTIHLGVAHTQKEGSEEFSNVTVKNEEGNDILYDGYIYIKEEGKLERYIFKSKDGYLYEYPNDGNIYENLTKFYPSKVTDIKVSESNDIKHLEVINEDGNTFEFDGIVGYRN